MLKPEMHLLLHGKKRKKYSQKYLQMKEKKP